MPFRTKKIVAYTALQVLCNELLKKTTMAASYEKPTL